MRTENGDSPVGLRVRRRVALAVLSFVCLTALVAPASGQEEDGEPPWRDLRRGHPPTRRVAPGPHRRCAKVHELVQAQLRLEQLRNGASTTTRLADPRAGHRAPGRPGTRASKLAVEAYIVGRAGGRGALRPRRAERRTTSPSAPCWRPRAPDAIARTQDDWVALQDGGVGRGHRTWPRLIDEPRTGDGSTLAVIDARHGRGPRSPTPSGWSSSPTIHAARRRGDGAVGSHRAHRLSSGISLRFCESTRNYQIDTGNSYYGAYQFNVRDLDRHGWAAAMPSLASTRGTGRPGSLSLCAAGLGVRPWRRLACLRPLPPLRLIRQPPRSSTLRVGARLPIGEVEVHSGSSWADP